MKKGEWKLMLSDEQIERLLEGYDNRRKDPDATYGFVYFTDLPRVSYLFHREQRELILGGSVWGQPLPIQYKIAEKYLQDVFSTTVAAKIMPKKVARD